MPKENVNHDKLSAKTMEGKLPPAQMQNKLGRGGLQGLLTPLCPSCQAKTNQPTITGHRQEDKHTSEEPKLSISLLALVTENKQLRTVLDTATKTFSARVKRLQDEVLNLQVS